MVGLTDAERRAASMAGLGRVLASSFGAHFLIALVSVVTVPIFLRLMGAQAYGLVTFYIVLQAWSVLFDLGVSPALARQLSRFRGGAVPAEAASSLLAAAETVFVLGGAAGIALFALASPWIAAHWLGRSSLPPTEIHRSLGLIGALVVLRWLTGLYQAALVGLERQVPVNAVALTGAVLRYGGAAAGLVMIAPKPEIFFGIQAAVALAEAVICRLLLAAAMPSRRGPRADGWRRLANEFRFALGLTVASVLAVVVGQADKLALSHAMPLAQFGLFGLVVSIIGGIAMVVPPFVQSFQPRLTALLAAGRRDEFVHVYRLSAAVILSLAAGLGGTIAAQPVWVIWAWTGRADTAQLLAPALSLYAAGSAVASFLFVPYLLQYAQGQVRLYVTGAVLFAALWVPLEVWAALSFGATGAGAVWLGGNVVYLLTWMPLVHARLLSRAERAGLDVGIWLRGLGLAVLLAATRLAPVGHVSRPEAFVLLAILSLAITALGAASSGELRAFLASAAGRFRRSAA